MLSTCPQCQAPILETQRFCRYCGARLSERLQEDEQTKTFEQATGRITAPGRVSSEPGALSPSPGGETMPLRAKVRRSRVLYAVLGLIVLSGLGAGIAFYQMGRDRQQTGRRAPAIWSEREFPRRPMPPPPPVPPSPSPQARPAPLKPPPPQPAPPRVSPNLPKTRSEALLSRILLTHAALTEQKIALLRKRLDSPRGMTPEERAQLLHEMRTLEQERMAVLTAAEVFKSQSETIENLLRGIIPIEEILKAIEAGQQKGWKRGPGDRLTDAERQELQTNVDRAMREVIKEFREAQRAKDELQWNR